MKNETLMIVVAAVFCLIAYTIYAAKGKQNVEKLNLQLKNKVTEEREKMAAVSAENNILQEKVMYYEQRYNLRLG